MAKYDNYVPRAERKIGLGDIWRSGLNLVWIGTESVNHGAENIYRASCVMDRAGEIWYDEKVAQYDAEHEATMAALEALDEAPEAPKKVASVK